MNYAQIVMAIAVIALAGATGYLFVENAGLQNQLAGLNAQIDQMQNEITGLSDLSNRQENTITNLNQEISNLENEKALLEANYEKLQLDYNTLSMSNEQLKSSVKEITAEIDKYQEDIASSMSWFRSNSQLGNHPDVKSYLKNMCFMTNSTDCILKSGCFYLVNDNYLGLKYKTDISATGKIDRLISIDQFIQDKGGDCEDYSLFYKAEYNYFLENCPSKNPDTFAIEAWQNTNGNEQYKLDYQNQWYFEGARAVVLKGYYHPAIICGTLYDPVSRTVNGHCVVAFTTNPIMKNSDVYRELNGAPMIEPQNGEFLGYLNETANVDIYNDNDDITSIQFIFTVITDNDYFLFDQVRKKWNSYSAFGSLLEEKKDYLAGLIS